MRTGCAAGAIVVAIAACGSSSAAPRTSPTAPARQAAAPCGPRSAKTLAASHRARVYSSHGGVYGCAAPRGRSYLLAANTMAPGQPHLGKLALAGVVAAYGETTSGIDTAGARVVVRRLDDGRTLRSLPAMSQALGPESFQSVNSIVVKTDGAVAWIAVARSIIRHSAQSEVDRAGRRGRARLDTGPGIVSTSLRLSGSSLSWRHGGATRTARLL